MFLPICFPLYASPWILPSICFPFDASLWMLTTGCFPLNAYPWILTLSVFPLMVLYLPTICAPSYFPPLYNIPLLLTPVAEYDPDASSVGSGGIRRHSACEIICLEEQGLAYADLASGPELSSSSANRLCVGPQFNGRVLFTRMDSI